MATVQSIIFRHHQKVDSTYNLKIQVYHKKEKRFISTAHYVSPAQLDASYELKDKVLIGLVEKTLSEYRLAIGQLGSMLKVFSCEELRDYLRDRDTEIDFSKFCREYITQLKNEGRLGSASLHQTVLNSLFDFFTRQYFTATEINSNMLMRYERYLRTERKLVRTDQFGREIMTVSKGLSDTGVHNYLRDLRTMFNAACRYYNMEDLDYYRIGHKPFKRFKIPPPAISSKRCIGLRHLMMIRDAEAVRGSRAELARDLFMLSFYLCGMNAVDIFHLKAANVNNGRVEYERIKTKGRRRDRAFISIKLVGPAKLLVNRYQDVLPKRFANHNILDTALSKGLKAVCEQLGIPKVTFYAARHIFASLARNECRMSKDDVGMALNHLDTKNYITDIYLKKDWRIIDDVQAATIDLLADQGLAAE